MRCPAWFEVCLVLAGCHSTSPLLGDAHHTGDAVVCSAAATYSPTFIAAGSGSSELATDDGSGVSYAQALEWIGLLQSSPEQFIDLRVYAGGGSGSGGTPDWPTGDVTPRSNIDLANAQDVSLFIGTDIDGSGQAQQVYSAIAGTLSITAVAPDFAGTGTALVFEQYDIDDGAPTPAPDKCMSSIAALSFSAPLATTDAPALR
jgi:hypothetical protein